MKKFLALLLALVMVISLAACGSKPAEPAPAPEAPAAEAPAAEAPAAEPAPAELEPVTLKMWFHGSNVQEDASKKVMEELNAYLKDKINVTLEPIWGTWGNFDDGVKTALAAGGDGVDIYFTCNWSADEYNKYARDGYWVKLDDMMAEYAPELQAIMPEGMWELAKTNGMDGYGVYAIPGMKDTATQNVWDVNATLLAELGYDVDKVVADGIDFYSDEFEEMLQKAKDYKNDPDFYPLNFEAVVLERMITHTAQITGDLSSTNCLSFYYDGEHPAKDLGNEFVNKFSTPEFKKYAERIRYLAEKGFVSPQAQNVGTANDYLNATRASANYLIGTEVYAYGCEKNFAAARGIDIVMIPETVPFRDATSGQGAMMAISSASKNAERALMFLNLLNTDPAVMTMVNYGTEGYTYNKNADGTITFTDERANYTPWTNGVGNIGILPDTDSEGAGFREEFVKFYNADYESVPYGAFTFDNSEYETEMTAIGDVAGQYAFGLMSGAVSVDDPTNGLDAFLAAMDAAGINEFVAAVNEQWHAYAAG